MHACEMRGMLRRSQGPHTTTHSQPDPGATGHPLTATPRSHQRSGQGPPAPSHQLPATTRPPPGPPAPSDINPYTAPMVPHGIIPLTFVSEFRSAGVMCGTAPLAAATSWARPGE